MTTNTYPRYNRYKDTGVEWLGKIPDHWDATPLFRILKERFVRNTGNRVQDVLSLSYGKIVPRDVDSNFGLLPESFETYQIVEPGNIVLRLTDLQNDRRSLRVGHAMQRGIVTSAYVNLETAGDLDNRYAYYLLNAYDRLKVFYGMGAGVRQTMKYADLKRMPCVLPPRAEQVAIATFLDRETARIDALIEKQERLIEKLEEKRKALISRAVTQGLPAATAAQAGLNSNVRMKDSGVEWLGKIPEHWVCLALSRVTISRCDGPFGSGLKSSHYTDTGVRVVRLQNIGYARFLPSDPVFIDADYYRNELGDHGVLTGDVLVAGLGDERHPVGRACVAPDDLGDAMVKADCFRFRLKPSVCVPQFVAYQFSWTAETAAGCLATGATRARMNLTTTGFRKIALPPMEEQRLIVEYLRRKEERTDSVIDQALLVRARLREKRTSLISAAVTGKIDVREVA